MDGHACISFTHSTIVTCHYITQITMKWKEILHDLFHFDASDHFLLISILLCLLVCPFTKVEESFNLQAIHDLLEYNPFISIDHETNTVPTLASFDHLSFPGVVPRSFIGPLLIAIPARIPHELLRLMGFNKIWSLLLVRSILGLVSFFAYKHFKNAVSHRYGLKVAKLMTYLVACSFHLPFYMTRTLNNVYALIGVLLAFAQWLHGDPISTLSILTTVTVIFRCDILILLGPITLQILWFQERPFLKVAYIGIVTGICSLALTVIVDSYLWNRGYLLWPEGVVLFFNTVENRSSEWGVMPWHWYLSSALLKVLHINLFPMFYELQRLWENRMDNYTKSMTEFIRAWKVIEDSMNLNVFVRDGWDTVRHTLIGGPKSTLVAQRIVYSYQENQLLEHGKFVLHFNAQDASKSSVSVELQFREHSGVDKGKGHTKSLHDLTRSPLYYLGPVILFIILYSFLPHKEMRFIYPIFPLLYLITAMGVLKLHRKFKNVCNSTPFLRNRQFSLVTIILSISTVLSAFFLLLSSYNYAGGYGMMGLNKDVKILINNRPNFQLPIKVHIDEFAAMNGVSRFVELRNTTLVQYSKQENLKLNDRLKKFDRLLTGSDDIVKLSRGRFELRAATLGFHRIRNRIKISKEKLKNMFLKLFERKTVKVIELVEEVEKMIEVESDMQGGIEGEKRKTAKTKQLQDENKLNFMRTLSKFSPIQIEMKEMIFHYSSHNSKKDSKKRKAGKN